MKSKDNGFDFLKLKIIEKLSGLQIEIYFTQSPAFHVKSICIEKYNILDEDYLYYNI